MGSILSRGDELKTFTKLAIRQLATRHYFYGNDNVIHWYWWDKYTNHTLMSLSGILWDTRWNEVLLKTLGFISLQAGSNQIEEKVNVTGLPKDDGIYAHGLHVHEFGQTTPGGCGSMGGHWNPDGVNHGAPLRPHNYQVGKVIQLKYEKLRV